MIYLKEIKSVAAFLFLLVHFNHQMKRRDGPLFPLFIMLITLVNDTNMTNF